MDLKLQMLSKEINFKYRHGLKIGWNIHHTNDNKKKFNVTIISGKEDFTTKILLDIKKIFHNEKASIQQEAKITKLVYT